MNKQSGNTNTILLVVVLLILVGGGVYWYMSKNGAPATQPAPQQGVQLNVGSNGYNTSGSATQ